MKKLAIIATITVGVIGLSACSSDDSEIVVETNSGNISKEEFYEEMKASSGEMILQQMVLSKILEEKYEIDEEALDTQVETYMMQYGEQWESVLMQSGYADEEEFRKELSLQMLQQEAMIDGIEVTDEEIELRYERLQTEVEASHILVTDEETSNDLKAQLDAGADFAELAEEHSTDGSAVEGGQLGYFSTGQMVTEFEDAAYGLAIDEISAPVQSQHGWHIIKVTDKRELEAEVQELEDIRDNLRQEIAMSKIDEATAMERMESLIEDADIKVNIEDFKDIFDMSTDLIQQ